MRIGYSSLLAFLLRTMNNPSIINPLANQLANEFVADHFDDLGADSGELTAEQLTFSVELWLVLAGGMAICHRGIELAHFVKRRANQLYRNDFAHPSHDTETRLDICQHLCTILLTYAGHGYGTPAWNMVSAWYDAAAVGRREVMKYGNGIGRPINLRP